MDAIEFVVEQARMCRSCKSCNDCPAYKDLTCGFNNSQVRTKEQAQKMVKIVWEWALEHPQETRWTLLKKQYPNMNDNAKERLCVRSLGYKCEFCDETNCAECWDVPVEE